MSGTEMAPVNASKYDKLQNWANVQDEILHVLKTQDRNNVDITLPNGLQLVTTLRHPNVLRCITTIKATGGHVFITHHGSGSLNHVNAWTVLHGSSEVNCFKFDIKPSINQLIFVQKHRVFVGYCADMTLRVFSDFAHGYRELSVTKCRHTIVCMAYNRHQDELLTGGPGCLLRWSMADFHERLVQNQGYEDFITREEWVLKVGVDHKRQILEVQCDNGIHVIDYVKPKQTHFLMNRHELSLTCTAHYPDRDYLITAASEGSIKVWNSTVFSLVQQLHGHQDSVTALQIHPTEPLLLSSSLDGTVRIWRLDTFEVQARLDIGDRIAGMKLLSSQEVAYWTDREIKIWRLNMFHSLLTPVHSAVYQLLRVQAADRPTRIVLSAEDGGLRFLSPVTGAILTIVYPMASAQVLTNIVYDQTVDRLYAVVQEKGVLVFDCSSNPCQVLSRLEPEHADQEILCLALVHASGPGGSFSFIFAGHKDGTVSLFQARRHMMPRPVQAHQSKVTLLQSSYGQNQASSESSTEEITIGEENRLISCGGDQSVKIWKLCMTNVDTVLYLMLMKTISVEGVPSHVCMMGNVMCLALEEKGKVHMFRLTDDLDPSKGRGIQEQSHSTEEDHTLEINGMDCCPALGIFATCGNDGTVKVWGRQNELLREMVFAGTLQGICFANDRGDILVGYQTHVHVVTVTNYLTPSLLERIALCDFVDDLREEPIQFNRDLPLWFDYQSVTCYPANLIQRRQLLQEVELEEENVAVQKLTEALQVSLAAAKLIGSKVTTSDTEELIKVASKEKIKKTGSKTKKVTKGKPGKYVKDTKEEDAAVSVTKDSSTRMPSRQPSKGAVDVQDVQLDVQDDTGSKVDGGKDDAAKTAGEKEQAEEKKVEKKKRYPVAPDGYIPNSVVRSLYNIKVDPPVQRQEPWKLKPVPSINPKYLPLQDESMEDLKFFLSEDSLVPPFEFENDEDKNAVDMASLMENQEPEKTDPTLTSGDSKQKGHGQEKGKKEKIKKTRFAPPDLTGLDSNLGKAKKPKRKTFKPGAIAEEDDAESGEEDDIPELFKKIKAESWFPKKVPPKQASIVSAFQAILDNVDESVHRQICGYIVDIHKQIGYSPDQRDKLVSKLLKHLEHQNVIMKKNAIQALTQLGLGERKDVLMALLQNIGHQDESVRQEIKGALKELAGVQDKDGLVNLFDRMGVMKAYNSRMDEDAALQELIANISRSSSMNEILERMEQWVELSDMGSHSEQNLLSGDQGADGGKEGAKTPSESLPRIKRGGAQAQGQPGNKVSTPGSRKSDGTKKGTPQTADQQSVQGQQSVQAHSTETDEYMQAQNLDQTEQQEGRRREDIKLPSLTTGKGQGTTGTDKLARGSGRPRATQNNVPQTRAPKTAQENVPQIRLPDENFRPGRDDSPGSGPRSESDQESAENSAKLRGSLLPDKPELYNMYKQRENSDTPPQDGTTRAPRVLIKTQSSDTGLPVEHHRVISPDTLKSADDESAKILGKKHVDGVRRSKGKKRGDKRGLGAGSLLDSASVQETPRTDISDGGLGTEVDSDIHSVSYGPGSQLLEDQPGQVFPSAHHDAASIGDSGIGQTTDHGDDNSSMYTKPGSLVSRGMPGLSPVKSMLDNTKGIPENWRQLFEQPSAQERRKMEEVKKEFSSGKTKPVSLPPIQYMSDDQTRVPADAGVRLLQTVTVSPKSDSGSGTKRHLVDALPGKLAVHTTNEDSGNSKFGIIDMRWTTDMPQTEPPGGHQQNDLPFYYDVQPHPSSQFPELAQLQDMKAHMLADRIKEGGESGSQSPVLPALSPGRGRSGSISSLHKAGAKSADFEWRKPMPPAPRKSWHKQHAPHGKSHQHYCDYYRLAKKRFHDYCSASGPSLCLPELVIMKAISKTSQLSRQSSRSRSSCSQSSQSESGAEKLPPITLQMILLCRT